MTSAPVLPRLALWVSILLVFSLQGCFLFPPSKPIDVPKPIDSSSIITAIPFTPTLDWVLPTRGVVMDVNRIGNIVTAGNIRTNGENRSAVATYNPQGMLLNNDVEIDYESGLVRELLADHDQPGLYSTVVDFPIRTRINYATGFTSPGIGQLTNPYTRYNTVLARPDYEPYPWSGYRYVVGPSIAKGPGYNQSLYYTSSWIVGAFTDRFKPFLGFGDNLTYDSGTCPTFGNADCFILRISRLRADQAGMPVRHQWGGTENDLAYDVASDDVGNATIFLRAGTDFAITSATQSLVRMTTGYNVVRLDTNGLLTETFPVQLQTTKEITDTKIALGKNGSVYILAKDQANYTYFLTKVSRSGTEWLRYLPPSVSDDGKTVPSNREARMDLTVDSKGCVYITGNFSGTIDLGGATLNSSYTQAFVAKYSPANVCLGALAMGSGLGVTVRLSPEEDALYVNGWAEGTIMGTPIPSQDDPRNGVLRPGAFLVKLKIGK
jgi:hypothetical protein